MTYPLSFTKTATITCTLALTLLQPMAWGQSPAHPASAAGSLSMQGSGMGKQGLDMQAMMKGNSDKMASMKMTGNTDVDFAMMMRVHHQGAIDIAEAELRDGKNAQMRKMAKDMIAAQKSEIAQFEKFLAKNGQPAGAMGK